MTQSNKPIASLSLDLDNQWSYMKTHGDAGWETYPSYLDIVVPRVLDILEEYHLKITFFIVGQDAALAENAAALKSIAEAGHEIGNHSFLHEQWLHLYTEEQIETDLTQAAQQIEQVTGKKPIGFRGPGFSLSLQTLQVLERLGYVYDASTFPTFLGPLARSYYFMTAKLTPEEKKERAKLFGTIADGLRPNKAYRWQMEPPQRADKLIEIPVTTMPIFKIPIHVSYILYLSLYSPFVALTYFRLALLLCRLTGTQLSLLLHPLDFLGKDDVAELAFFPAMGVPSEKKLTVVKEILRLLNSQFTVLTMEAHAQHIAQQADLATLTPNFSPS